MGSGDQLLSIFTHPLRGGYPLNAKCWLIPTVVKAILVKKAGIKITDVADMRPSGTSMELFMGKRKTKKSTTTSKERC